ncbi:MAG: acyl-CoA dehydrogenase family protein [Dehalococcoidia bacterium]|nr:acyl-CoA dehydrogenase family protein [Dehalococcoidia bacterium]
MDFGFSKEEETFRQQVRGFLNKEVTPQLLEETESGLGWGPHTWEFIRKLGAKGWLTPTWPKEYGGLALPPIYRFIIHEELNYFGALPSEALVVGAGVAGPTIIMYGSEEQKKEYLPRIARGEIEFALGYTEPEAGSDLASLQIRAEEKEDHYLLNGQKVYNTRCHFAQYHWLAVRTDPNVPKHRGISLFIVDLNSPGITVSPLWTVEGMRTNEVFYDNVVVPKQNLVGEKNRGFFYTVTALEFERVLSVGGLKKTLEVLVDYVKKAPSLRDNSLVRQKISQIAIDIEVARLFAYRLAWLQTKRVMSSYEAAASKLFTSELSQRMASAGMDILGLRGLLQRNVNGAPLDGKIEHLCRETLLNTIAGGTSEVMRNIIATRGLELPR